MKITLETEFGNLDIDLTVTYSEPFVKAKLTGHPDTRTPDQGGTIEYEINSVAPEGEKSFSIGYWEWMDLEKEEKIDYSSLIYEGIRIKRGDIDEEQDDKICELIFNS